jgi:hypothetical protein
VKSTKILATLLAAVLLASTGCGVSDSVKSITLSSSGSTVGGFYNLAGVDGTLQLVVTVNYHSGKTVIVTNDSTWSVTPVVTIYSTADFNYPAGGSLPAYGPNTVPISTTGLMTGIAAICTWEDLIDASKTPAAPFNPPEWAYTGFYQVTATYRGLTSQPVGIGVGVAESNSPTGGCGPS